MKPSTYEFFDRLIAAISPSGYEEEAMALWSAEARTFAAEVRTDSHGNTDAVINPGGSPRVMLAGHIDEIGFVITHIDEKGFLWVGAVGGWDSQIPQGQRVVIRGRKGLVPGVFGKCPIHLQKEESRNKVVKLDELWVDIGVKKKKDAEKLVSIGDPLVLDHKLCRLQDDRVVGRAFDDRAGAFVVLEAARILAKQKPQAEIHAVATVQEEVGLRGARTAAFGIDPQFGFAVDVTFATDDPGSGGSARQEGAVSIGKGPVITRGPNINERLFRLLKATAEKEKIACQVVAEPRGTGTDANAIQLNRAGVATALLSIPNRYMHSPCELISLTDLEKCAELLAAAVLQITPELDCIPRYVPVPGKAKKS